MFAEAPAERLRRHLEGLVAEGVFSSVVASVDSRDGVEPWVAAAGEAQPGISAQPETLFDFASITKPFVATLALVLDASGQLPLATPIGEVWADAHPDLRLRPLEDLLRHRSGLAAWTPLYLRCSGADDSIRLIVSGGQNGELLGADPGTYSDLGLILWGATAERACGSDLAALVASHVLAPLGLGSVLPAPGARRDVAASRMGTAQEVELARAQGFAVGDQGPTPLGLPQDGNARFLLLHGFGGGLIPHSGLFGRAADLRALAQEWLSPGRLLQPEAVRRALAPGPGDGGAIGFHLGWWRHSPAAGGGGEALSASSFGHTGFAGGNLWVDPHPPDGRAGGAIYVLLGSRIDPDLDLNRRRREFHAFAAGLRSAD